MTNYEQQKIQKTLKFLMKQKKITYQSIGKMLKISPATVKRRLNGKDLSLLQLKEFAECLSLSFYEIIELSKQDYRKPHLFTESQEKLLASDILMMSIFRMILAGQRFLEIRQYLGISDQKLRKAAKDLEKVSLAKLLPGDRFVPIAQFPFHWRPNGILSKTYNKLILENLLRRIEKNRQSAGLHKQFEIALSPEIYENFCKEIQNCYEKYRGLSELYLTSSIEWNNLVSGIFFIDRFSLWESSDKKDIIY